MAPSSACSASRLWGAALNGSAAGEAVSGAVAAARRRAVLVMGEASLTRRWCRSGIQRGGDLIPGILYWAEPNRESACVYPTRGSVPLHLSRAAGRHLRLIGGETALLLEHVVARQRQRVDPLGQLQLEDAQAAVPEARLARLQIELPHAAKAVVVADRVELAHALAVGLEAAGPFLERRSVVQA